MVSLRWERRALLTLMALTVPLVPPSLSASARPGQWRAVPHLSSAMLERARGRSERLDELTVESVVAAAFLDNRDLSDAQLAAISQVRLEALAEAPETVPSTLRAEPDARSHDGHRFTVAVLSALTGVDATALSLAAPGLGLTGAPSAPFLFAPRLARLKRSTALHDVTDYLRGAGVVGVNAAVWGVESREVSALFSFIGGAPLRDQVWP